MATPAALKALEDTTRALKDIRTKVQPLLATLRSSSHDNDTDNVALARAGVAMTAGTLRFLAQRLRGCKAGTAADPLRLELNRMRHVLVQVQTKASAATAQAVKRDRPNDNDDEKQQQQQQQQQQQRQDTPAKPAAKRRRTK